MRHARGMRFAASLLLIGAMVVPAMAEEGNIDARFGSGGRYGAGGAPLHFLPDGRIVSATADGAAGQLQLRFATSEGMPDTTFGPQGILGVPIQPGQVGRVRVSGAQDGSFYVVLQRADALEILHVDGMGNAVPRFGIGGRVVFELVNQPNFRAVWPVAIHAVADGGVVIALVDDTNNAYFPEDGCPTLSRLLWFDADGAPLPAYSNGALLGVDYCDADTPVRLDTLTGTDVLLSYSGLSYSGVQLLMGKEGSRKFPPPAAVSGLTWYQISAGGGRYDYLAGLSRSSPRHLQLSRLNADLSADPSYGSGAGRVQVDFSPAMDGSLELSSCVLLAKGASPEHLFAMCHMVSNAPPQRLRSVLARLHLDGTLDATFGSGGLLLVADGDSFAVPLTGQAGGKVLLGDGRFAIRLQGQPAPSPGVLNVQYSLNSVRVDRDARVARVGVVRTLGSSGAVSVRYGLRPTVSAAEPWAAEPGIDYQDVGGTLSWADGESGVRYFDVPIIYDPRTKYANVGKGLDVVLQAPLGGALLVAAVGRVWIHPPAAGAQADRIPGGGTDAGSSGGGGAAGVWWLSLMALCIALRLSRKSRSLSRVFGKS